MNKRRYVVYWNDQNRNIRDKTHKQNDANTNPIILDEYSRFS